MAKMVIFRELGLNDSKFFAFMDHLKSSRWPLEPYLLGKIRVSRLIRKGHRKLNKPMVDFMIRPDLMAIQIELSYKELREIKAQIERVLEHERDKRG